MKKLLLLLLVIAVICQLTGIDVYAFSQLNNDGTGKVQFVSVNAKGTGNTNPSKMNPKDINFMQDTCQNVTRDGQYTVIGNIKKLQSGQLTPEELPTIKVWRDADGKVWTLDHRRLASYRGAGVKEIPVEWATPAEIEKAGFKMTTQNGGSSIDVVFSNGKKITIK